MRRWLAIALILAPGAAHAATPTGAASMPIASRFDLSRFMMHPVAQRSSALDDSRWLAIEIAPPPGPPHDAPLVRIRGKKVKFRMSF